MLREPRAEAVLHKVGRDVQVAQALPVVAGVVLMVSAVRDLCRAHRARRSRRRRTARGDASSQPTAMRDEDPTALRPPAPLPTRLSKRSLQRLRRPTRDGEQTTGPSAGKDPSSSLFV